MKNIIVLTLGLILSLSMYAQNQIKEPNFIGEAVIVNADNTTTKLEKQTVQIKTRAGASMYIVGVGKVKSKIQVPNAKSSVSIKKPNELKIIVRAKNNENDPLSFIQIFKFDVKGKKRLAELASAGTFSGVSENNLNYLDFEAEKYGEKSYILNVKGFKNNSEYGIYITNPDVKDEKKLVISSFGIK
jgi:hypothetical protein